MATSVEEYRYHFDTGRPILLHDITVHRCACGRFEAELPRLVRLQEAISQAICVMRVGRDRLSFRFELGPSGVTDGAWGVVIRS